MLEYAESLLTPEEFDIVKTRVNLLREVVVDDEELVNAFLLGTIFGIKQICTSTERAELVGTMNESGYPVTTDTLRTLGVILKKDSHEHDMCSDVIILSRALYVQPSYPLGYLNPEILRSMDIHEKIDDEEVESSIDRVMKIVTDIMFLQTEEVQQLACAMKSGIVDRIYRILSYDVDLTLMSQVKEACRVLMEWGC